MGGQKQNAGMDGTQGWNMLQMLMQPGGLSQMLMQNQGSQLGGGTAGKLPLIGNMFNQATKNMPLSNAGISQIANGSLLGGAGAAGNAAGAAGAAGGAGGLLSTILGLIGL